MLFAVFLDVDGVLNTKTTYPPSQDWNTWIDEDSVKILANPIKKYACYEVILTSDWKKVGEYDDDYLYLLEKLDLYGVLADFDRGVMELAGFNRNGANANSDIKG